MEFLVDLNQVEDVKEFVEKASHYDNGIMVQSKDRAFRVDASSIMGVFSLDLSRPVKVVVNDVETCESFKNDIWKFIVEDKQNE